jgi:hypothetical protein
MCVSEVESEGEMRAKSARIHTPPRYLHSLRYTAAQVVMVYKGSVHPHPSLRVDVYFPPKVPKFLSPYLSLPYMYCISLEISREITGTPLVGRTRLM